MTAWTTGSGYAIYLPYDAQFACGQIKAQSTVSYHESDEHGPQIVRDSAGSSPA